VFCGHCVCVHAREYESSRKCQRVCVQGWTNIQNYTAPAADIHTEICNSLHCMQTVEVQHCGVETGIPTHREHMCICESELEREREGGGGSKRMRVVGDKKGRIKSMDRRKHKRRPAPQPCVFSCRLYRCCRISFAACSLSALANWGIGRHRMSIFTSIRPYAHTHTHPNKHTSCDIRMQLFFLQKKKKKTNKKRYTSAKANTKKKRKKGEEIKYPQTSAYLRPFCDRVFAAVRSPLT